MEDVPYFCQFSTSRLPQECPSPAPPELTPPPSSARLDTGDIPTVSTTVVRQHINAYQLSVGFRFSSLFFPWSPEQLPAAVEKWLGRQQWKNYHPSGPCKAGGGARTPRPKRLPYNIFSATSCTRACVIHITQEAQLMPTNPRDAFGGQSKSENTVPFDMLRMVSY